MNQQFPNSGLGYVMDAPARRGARIGAFLIDSLVVGIAASVFKSMGATGIEYVVTILYFVIAHKQFGQTLGKKAFNIKLISTDPNHLDISWKQVLIRETFGRFLSAFVLMIGYLQFFFVENRKTWHDQMSSTQVVEVDALRSEGGFPVLKMLGISVAAIAGIIGVLVYIGLFTSYPLKQMVARLELTGIQVSGIKGSLARGFSFQSFSFQDGNSQVDLQDVTFHYDLFKFYMEDSFIIHRISVKEGKFKLLKFAGQSTARNKQDEKKPDAKKPQGSQAKRTNKSRPISFIVKRVEIGNLSFESAMTKTYQLKRFFIDEFVIKEKKVDVSRVWIESDAFLLDIHQFHASKDRLSLGKIAHFLVKKELFPQVIKADINLQAKINFSLSEKKVRELLLTAFDRRVQVSQAAGGFQIQTYGFSPDQYLNLMPPLKNVNLKLEGDFPAILMKEPIGNFSVRNFIFKSHSFAGFIHQRGSQHYLLSISPAALSPVGGGPVFKILRNSYDTKEEWLANLYYGRSLPALTAEENLLVQTDAVHFAVEAPALRLPSSVIPSPSPSTPRSGQPRL